MKEWYQMHEDEVLEALGSDANGLSSEKAEALLKAHGENVLRETKKKSVWRVFAEQFADLLVIILIIAAIISMISGNVESTIVIFAVITMNAILGTVQHEKAEKSLASLKTLSAPTAKVLRGGVKGEIPSAQVVKGDILLLEAGDMVTADGRILESYSLQVNESSLTGESTNVEKKTVVLEGEKALGDRINMVYSGSLVTGGRAVVLVTATGMETEIGKIAALMNATKEKRTPLQVSLDKFGSQLAIVIMIISAVVFVLSLYRKMPVLDSLMFAVALAVAAIPEALSSIVTIVQAMGTQKMAREHAIIKDLKAVESLGCVSVICSDKTGTLTQNKMTVQQVYINHQTMEADALDLKQQSHRYLLYDAILTNDSAIVEGQSIGDPTEVALLEMGRKVDIKEDILKEMMPRMEEIPFDSDRKLMSTKYRLHGVPTILVKGALDILLKRTDRIRIGDEVRPITEQDVKEILDKNQAFSEQGLRVLAFAYKEAQANQQLTLDEEDHLIFIGLVSMIDPPREESREAVSEAKRAGIRPVMITGDHKITATAIAEQIGIFGEGDMAVTGPELDEMSDAELDENIEKISVYARVSPENKIRIVDAWQRKGAVTAMTGDGVNDAPALKKADIGVAMGITGTEVSKDAASMILTDDNFATIIKAVANGRNVYRNIKNAVKFLLSGNMAGIMAVLYTSLAALPVPFQPVHLLFINLLTDSLPAIAIGMEKAEKDLLSEPPRDPKQGILTKDLMTALFVQGGLIAVCTMIAFYIGLSTDSATASSMAFATLTLARLFHGFNCRSRHSIFKIGLASNIYSVGAFFGGVLLLALVIFVPVMRTLFSVSPLSGYQIGMIALLAFIPTVIIQLYKVMKEHVHA
ncbi:cation-translocating P-type ATPase [Agathobaculum butyriciproducens]|uniref:cation-translocating P-type ATPase n=1 Tax=Coprococcus sp. B2-R-112 TaxID=2949662 RepID=UPI00202FC9EC|nr:cation-translocating P-type ATPase [Coprococcus sp. B2-R-112]MCM0662643.1 cation-translocating P-type ATPase [Coprococcus sp. B2-R-112]MCQ5055109.1 cation-translocating P-type ATPase [Agathobaculum butyriciproducens]